MRGHVRSRLSFYLCSRHRNQGLLPWKRKSLLRNWRLVSARPGKHVADLGDLTFRLLRRGVEFRPYTFPVGSLRALISVPSNCFALGPTATNLPSLSIEAEWIEVTVQESALSVVEHCKRFGLVRFTAAAALSSMALASWAVPNWPCCANVAAESVRAAVDSTPIMSLRIMVLSVVGLGAASSSLGSSCDFKHHQMIARQHEAERDFRDTCSAMRNTIRLIYSLLSERGCHSVSHCGMRRGRHGRRSAEESKSVEVAGRILDHLARAQTPVALRELAAAGHMSPGKVHRYLASFLASGLARQDPDTRQYALGPLAMRLGLAALNSYQPLRDAMALQHELRDHLDETMVLSVWGTQGPTIVHVEESSQPIIMTMRVGAVLPCSQTATRTGIRRIPPTTFHGAVHQDGAQAQGRREPVCTRFRRHRPADHAGPQARLCLQRRAPDARRERSRLSVDRSHDDTGCGTRSDGAP